MISAIAVVGGRDRFKKDDLEKRSKSALTLRALALVIGIVSVIIFFLTENWRLPVVAIGEWTILMFILFIATLIIAFASFRLDDNPGDKSGGKEGS